MVLLIMRLKGYKGGRFRAIANLWTGYLLGVIVCLNLPRAFTSYSYIHYVFFLVFYIVAEVLAIVVSRMKYQRYHP